MDTVVWEALVVEVEPVKEVSGVIMVQAAQVPVEVVAGKVVPEELVEAVEDLLMQFICLITLQAG